MKKFLPAFVLLFYCSIVYSQETVTEVARYNCGTNCRATFYSDGLFKVEKEDQNGPNAVMGDFRPTTDENGKWNLNTSSWAQQMKNVSKVVVADGVEHIGDYAFYGARNATDIEISNSVTSIGQCGVGGTGFTHVEIPDSVTSLGIHAFHAMANLQTASIPGSVVEITSVYEGPIIPTLITQSPNVSAIYCDEKIYDFCANALSRDGSLNLLKTYSKNGDVYMFDGTAYRSIENYEKGKPIKRIYTVEEANKVAGKKNTIKIRYR